MPTDRNRERSCLDKFANAELACASATKDCRIIVDSYHSIKTPLGQGLENLRDNGSGLCSYFQSSFLSGGALKLAGLEIKK